MRVPLASYRLQLNADFGFAAARRIVPYLEKLGVSDIYASPIVRPRRGSRHGYDIVDPTRINDELGSETELQALLEDLRSRGMSWLQDIVPNHMAFSSDNRALMDLLESGEKSPFYRYFDIDWEHPYKGLRGRLLAPFLGKFYAVALNDGDIRLGYDREGLHISYFSWRFPIRLESYAKVLEHDLGRLESALGTANPTLIRYIGVAHLFGSIAGDRGKAGGYDRIAHAKRMLWDLFQKEPGIRAFIEGNVALFNGRPGQAESFDLLDELLSAQRFQLSFWKFASEEINYRRFFTINELICMRVEDERVFDFLHEKVLGLARRGLISGVRADHIDGLFDPAGYLRRLREKAGDIYIAVEKILGRDEHLPEDWPVQGTTGYDFLNEAGGLFCRREAEKEMTRAYYDFARLGRGYDELLARQKRMIAERYLAGGIDGLALHIKAMSSQDRQGRDITLHHLRKAIVEVLAHFPVYRTYIDSERFSEQDKRLIHEAIDKAKAAAKTLRYEIDFLEKFLLLRFPAAMGQEERSRWVDFAMNLQQHAAPLMAKGLEDTVFYVYNRLCSLNEVGGSPIAFGRSAEEFHAFCARRSSGWPHAVNATSTHDAKRGEDVRARIHALSELSREWAQQVRSWARLNRGKKRRRSRQPMPDANDEYLVYQTLVGTFPWGGSPGPEFTARMKQYVIKAVREAQLHSDWVEQDEAYEQACESFLEKILDPSAENEFLRDFLPFQRKVAHYGALNSLSQTLLKLAAPGLPDFYQGCELWDLSLVDPDNRRPVDFAARGAMLDRIVSGCDGDPVGLASRLLEDMADGAVKLFLIHRGLAARRRHPELFREGDYVPLQASGRAGNVVAFARRRGTQWCVAIAPRMFAALVGAGELPLGDRVWGDARLELPQPAPARWTDAVTGSRLEGRVLPLADALAAFPVALLLSEGGLESGAA
ncbi:MAG: malto-oligosyltrehalose synthase [Elusimicrobiota bacterium]